MTEEQKGSCFLQIKKQTPGSLTEPLPGQEDLPDVGLCSPKV